MSLQKNDTIITINGIPSNIMRLNTLLFAIMLCICCNRICAKQAAKTGHVAHTHQTNKQKPAYAKQRIETHVVIDYTSGDHKVLQQMNKDVKIYPASLTKMMTVYILLDKIAKGEYKLSDKFKVSRNAERQEASKTPAKMNETFTIEDTIKAIMAWSANDMAVVVAENVAGSVANFCKLMNAKARELKMYNTNFCNPSGLHDPRHVSTANDMAKLAIALSERFHKYKYLLSADSYKYKNTTYRTRCKISKMMNGVHCAKTGFTYESWFNLATTATRYNKNNDEKKVCVVVIGRQTSDKRYRDTISYMNNAFKKDYVYTNRKKDRQLSNCIDKIMNDMANSNISDSNKLGKKQNTVSSKKTEKTQDISGNKKVNKTRATGDKNKSGIIYIEEILYVIDNKDMCIGNDGEEDSNVIIEM